MRLRGKGLVAARFRGRGVAPLIDRCNQGQVLDMCGEPIYLLFAQMLKQTVVGGVHIDRGHHEYASDRNTDR